MAHSLDEETPEPGHRPPPEWWTDPSDVSAPCEEEVCWEGDVPRSGEWEFRWGFMAGVAFTLIVGKMILLLAGR